MMGEKGGNCLILGYHGENRKYRGTPIIGGPERGGEEGQGLAGKQVGREKN